MPPPFQLHPPATKQQPGLPPAPSPAPFSSEFLSMMQEMIRIEVRNYMSGSGSGADVHAATQRMMGMAKIE
jgi:myb proto-oncogene protein